MLIFIEILENSMFGRKKEDYPRMGKDKDESKIVFTKDKEIWQENNIENKKLNDNKVNQNKIKQDTIILQTSSGIYYGGHKAHLAGGYVQDSIQGELILTNTKLIFVKYKIGWKLMKGITPVEDWRIIIPLKDILVEKWTVEEKSRRKSVSGGNIPLAFGISHIDAKIEESGKTHNLVVPYIDNNGIEQEPRFGVKSFTGKAIKKWAETFYNLVAEIHKYENQKKSKEQPQEVNHQEDPLNVLKLRLAKGEITKEEFEELKEVLKE